MSEKEFKSTHNLPFEAGQWNVGLGHPWVHQGYPCSLCYSETDNSLKERQMHDEQEKQYHIDMERHYELMHELDLVDNLALCGTS